MDRIRAATAWESPRRCGNWRRNRRSTRGRERVLSSSWTRWEYEKPKTKALVELLGKVGGEGKKVLLLTAADSHNVYLSGRNIPDVR